MKRTLLRTLLLSLLLVLLAGLCVFAAQAATSCNGKHEWSEWQTTKEATCEKEGLKIRYCLRCRQQDPKTIPAKGHNWGKRIWVKQPDCTHQGTFYRTCTRCGKKTETYREKALGHDWGKQVVTKKADCTHEGVYTSTCSRCKQQKTEKIKALGHDWGKETPTKKADCTHEGVYTSTCSRCKEQKTVKTVKALGHDWGEGTVVKAPGFLEPGVKTYTCSRCGEEKAEEIPVENPLSGGSIMNKLRNGPTDDILDENALHIVTQPEGGTIAKGGSMILTVEAEGGEGEYTYVWRRRYRAYIWQSLFPWHTVENTEGGSCEADLGNYKYYCQVYDEAGHKVDSKEVLVGYELYIDHQPESENMFGKESVTLVCWADGGTPYEDGSYLYTCYDAEGNKIGTDKNRLGGVPVKQAGEYYFTVEDSTSKLLTSDPCTVYNADGMEIAGFRDYYNAGPVAELEAAVLNGVPPYRVEWYQDSVLAKEETLESSSLSFSASEPGEYSVLVHDKTDRYALAYTQVYGEALTILQQPQGGKLNDETDLELSITIGSGVAPFRYDVLQLDIDGIPSPYYSTTSDSHKYAINVYDEGDYLFEVTDAEQRHTRSDIAQVREDLGFHIADCSYTANVTEPGGSTKLYVKAEGGTEPYLYIWKVWKSDYPAESPRYLTDGKYVRSEETEANFIYTNTIGARYCCVVTDKEGRIAEAGPMLVEYTGELFIDSQPVECFFRSRDSSVTQTLRCKAYSGACAQEKLQYRWEKKGESGWKDMGKGPELNLKQSRYTSFENQISGTYRCVVTDPVSGKSVTSEPAKVYWEMKLDASYDSAGPAIIFTVQGGVAPYSYTIVRKRADPILEMVSIYEMGITCKWRWDGTYEGCKHIEDEMNPVYYCDIPKTDSGHFLVKLNEALPPVEEASERTTVSLLFIPIVDEYSDFYDFCWTYVFTVKDSTGKESTYEAQIGGRDQYDYNYNLEHKYGIEGTW
ncbi:MAG: hypothetical protein K5663_08130 [Clostridiales bacterium]|nr:hypothetical protein [Clostridiales bacterium]